MTSLAQKGQTVCPLDPHPRESFEATGPEAQVEAQERAQVEAPVEAKRAACAGGAVAGNARRELERNHPSIPVEPDMNRTCTTPLRTRPGQSVKGSRARVAVKRVEVYV